MNKEKILHFEGLNTFIRGKGSKKALDIGIFKNLIDWQNLPELGIWKIIAGTSEEDFDECVIRIYAHDGFHMIKPWENSAAEGEWVSSWDNDGPVKLGTNNELEGWLKKNDVFNMIRLAIIDNSIKPGWESLTTWG